MGFVKDERRALSDCLGSIFWELDSLVELIGAEGGQHELQALDVENVLRATILHARTKAEGIRNAIETGLGGVWLTGSFDAFEKGSWKTAEIGTNKEEGSTEPAHTE